MKLKIEKAQNILLELFERKVTIPPTANIKQEIEESEDHMLISNIEVKVENVESFSYDPLVSVLNQPSTSLSKTKKSNTTPPKKTQKNKARKVTRIEIRKTQKNYDR